MSKPRNKKYYTEGFRLHRWNPEEIFDLTNNSKYWKKTILEKSKRWKNYEENDDNSNST